tara:strand:+ start:288 stop:431 length:144 start_codon:yes stop_codon:yes gene_type:complete
MASKDRSFEVFYIVVYVNVDNEYVWIHLVLAQYKGMRNLLNLKLFSE